MSAAPHAAAPHAVAPAKSPRKAQSGPAVNASLQESEGGTGAAAAAASKAAMMDELEQQADQLSNRADAVDASLDRLQQQQSASGYGLRGDIVSRRSSMKTNLSKAQNAVQQGDMERAKKYMTMAQSDVEALEHFLGH
jgi:hypothetical protein